MSPEVLTIPSEPDVHVSDIASAVMTEFDGTDVRTLLEECVRRGAIAMRQEASRRALGASSVKAAWNGIMAITVEGE